MHGPVPRSVNAEVTRNARTAADTKNAANAPAAAGGTVYVSDVAGGVYALDAVTDRLRWSYTPGDAAGSRLAAAGGTVYIGSGDGTVTALDAATGRVRWTYATGTPADSSPAAVAGSGRAGVGSGEGRRLRQPQRPPPPQELRHREHPLSVA